MAMAQRDVALATIAYCNGASLIEPKSTAARRLAMPVIWVRAEYYPDTTGQEQKSLEASCGTCGADSTQQLLFRVSVD